MTEETFIQIENYLLNRMTEVERLAFDQRISLDKDLRNEVELMGKLHKGIHAAGREQLRKQIFPPQKIPFMVRLNSKWAVAIPILFFVAAIVIYKLIFPLQNERFFQAYYQRIDSINLAKPRGEDVDYDIKTRAFQEYRKGQYDSAIELLKKIETPDDESSLITGLARIEQRDWDEAKKELRTALEESESNSQTAAWYLALTQVRTKNYQAATELLLELAGNPNPYQARAKELMAKLK